MAEEVRRKIESFAPGGGYILCPTHNLQADVPGPNAVALARAGVECGRYPDRAHVPAGVPVGDGPLSDRRRRRWSTSILAGQG